MINKLLLKIIHMKWNPSNSSPLLPFLDGSAVVVPKLFELGKIHHGFNRR